MRHDSWSVMNRKLGYGKTKWECFICKKDYLKPKFAFLEPTDLIVHHQNTNRKDNRPKNLFLLCQSCHRKLHRIKKGSSLYNKNKFINIAKHGQTLEKKFKN